jgi:predicted ATPase
VTKDHIIFGLLKTLSNFDVPVTSLHLAGLEQADFNSLVCDALHILPRFCKRLSDVICHRTDGNPLFGIELLRSLVERNLVQYSLRERRWMYDIDRIWAEDINLNVVELILNKMSSLTNDLQSALQIASCFGMQVDAIIINALSSQYPHLCSSMAKLVESSFMDYNGSTFRFVHDKIREAAYGLFQDKESRDKCHFRLGIILQCHFGSILATHESDLLFVVIEQINYGLPDLVGSVSQQISFAELNCRAGRRRVVSSKYDLRCILHHESC